MRSRLNSRLVLLSLLAVVVLIPACSKEAPPAPAPAPPPPAPMPKAQPAPAPAEPAAVGDWEEAAVTPQTFLSIDEINRQKLLKTVYFDFDRAEIRADQRATLQANAAWLREHPEIRVLITGNCDERGTREYNLALGDRRAQAARDYLISLGITADRIETLSYGEERPSVEGHDESAWAQNRRDEFVALGDS